MQDREGPAPVRALRALLGLMRRCERTEPPQCERALVPLRGRSWARCSWALRAAWAGAGAGWVGSGACGADGMLGVCMLACFAFVRRVCARAAVNLRLGGGLGASGMHVVGVEWGWAGGLMV